AERPVTGGDGDRHVEQRCEVLPNIELGVLAADENRDLAVLALDVRLYRLVADNAGLILLGIGRRRGSIGGGLDRLSRLVGGLGRVGLCGVRLGGILLGAVGLGRIGFGRIGFRCCGLVRCGCVAGLRSVGDFHRFGRRADVDAGRVFADGIRRRGWRAVGFRSVGLRVGIVCGRAVIGGCVRHRRRAYAGVGRMGLVAERGGIGGWLEAVAVTDARA